MRTTRHPAATRHRSIPATSTPADAIGQALHAPRAKHRASAALMLAALALAAPIAQAQSTDWQGVDGGDWYDPVLWSPVAPDADTDAYVRSGGGAVINGGAAQARDLFINRGFVNVSNGAVLSTQRLHRQPDASAIRQHLECRRPDGRSRSLPVARGFVDRYGRHGSQSSTLHSPARRMKATGCPSSAGACAA